MIEKIQNIGSSYRIMDDGVVQGKYMATAKSPEEIISNYQNSGSRKTTPVNLPDVKKNDQQGEMSRWKLTKDITSYPQYSSDRLLLDALYNMSLEELIVNIEADGTFRTGALWEGVWTRDISYSILLSLAFLEPEICKNSLLRKVKNGRIIQDTGTGGAYPVSTDRVVWAIAAWELYVVKGEKDWLEQVYPIIKDSLEDDMLNAFNSKTGLVKGESSFLDWREQSYPDWMQPADIYESETLGTSAVHYKAHIIVSEMASELGETEVAEKHRGIAETIKSGINDNLWLDSKGYYGQYLYGRNHKILSTRSESLGEALTVLFDIAQVERQNVVVGHTPVTDFGIPSIYPQIPEIPSYHNDGIWPFVQAFWSLAAARVGNEVALTQSLDALYRAAALFLTNKENFAAGSGDYDETVKNSDRQLWSVAGNLGMAFKVFFGMEFQKDRLVFKPFVPESYKGAKRISGFQYRNCILDLELHGHGNKVHVVELDGKPLSEAVLPGDLEGRHHLLLKLIPTENTGNRLNLLDNYFSLKAPKVKKVGNMLVWDHQQHAFHYQVLKNGKIFSHTDHEKIVVDETAYGEYQVIAIDSTGVESFASEPTIISPVPPLEVDLAEFTDLVQRKYNGFTGKGYVPVSIRENKQVKFELEISQQGKYSLIVKYSNGHGPVNTDNRCAFRSLLHNDKNIGTLVFPQRGEGNWEEWGNSNPVQIDLKPGINKFAISLERHNTNMYGDTNEAMLDRVILTRMA